MLNVHFRKLDIGKSHIGLTKNIGAIIEVNPTIISK